MLLDGSHFSARPQARSVPVGGAGKRIFDVVAAALALLALSVVFLGVMLLIWITDGRPFFIRHTRIGYGAQPFGCWKFRTMVVDAQDALTRHLAANPEAEAEWNQTQKLKNDPRITPVGRVLRQLSIDELPQLLNILSGEMSVVGPRPIVAAEVEKYGPAIDDYLAARPGLTGLWQISGRSDTTYETRVRFDCEYVRNWSMGRDVAIIAKTVPVVIRSQGSY